MFPGKNGFSCIYIYVAMDHYYLHIKIKDDYENKEIALPLWRVENHTFSAVIVFQNPE